MEKYNEQLSSLIAKTSIIKNRDVLKNIKPNDFKNILIYINSQLTDNAVNECLSDYMKAGDVVSPTTEVKNYVISNLFELIQKSDDKTSGELLYYIMLDLHIFKDGNGRTSRFLYDIYNDSFGEWYWYKHEQNKESGSYPENFCFSRSIPDESIVNKLNGIEMKKEFDTFIEKYPYLNKKGWFKTVLPKKINAFLDGRDDIPEDIKRKFLYICRDGSGRGYTSSGYAFLRLAVEKGIMNSIIEKDKIKYKNSPEFDYIFAIGPNDFETFNTEECIKIIEYGNYFRKKEFDNLANIIINSKIKNVTLDDENNDVKRHK